MLEFLAMGGYALFVWPAYAATVLVLSLGVVLPLRRHRQLTRELELMAIQHDQGQIT
ncbi:heme exporter protein CcmD [Gammaproteobacteria bacterium]|nr:heme exporter protein CcmD [Gammaproteobacteria bacterium]